MDDLMKAGKIRHYGVSVEKVEEALKAIEYPNVQSIQIIYNIFRQRPASLFSRRRKSARSGDCARAAVVGPVDWQDERQHRVRRR
jgi:aryl-alcohol dehydrogenase-like predicted oxidoreductase